MHFSTHHQCCYSKRKWQQQQVLFVHWTISPTPSVWVQRIVCIPTQQIAINSFIVKWMLTVSPEDPRLRTALLISNGTITRRSVTGQKTVHARNPILLCCWEPHCSRHPSCNSDDQICWQSESAITVLTTKWRGLAPWLLSSSHIEFCCSCY